MTRIDKKSLVTVIICYVLWGVQSLYWGLLEKFDSMFVLASRIIWAAILLFALLAAQKRLGELKAVFTNAHTMRFLVPATLFLLVDWGVFIWAVQAGHVLDVSLGYYMMPLVVFSFSILLFKEKCGWLQFVAIGLTVAGVVFSFFYYGSFPGVSLILAFAFAIYAAFKKSLKIDPVVSICAESIILLPLATVYLLVFCRGAGGLADVNGTDMLYLVFSGVVTALPMVLYSVGVNNLPLLLMGFCQYISPTIGIFCGLILGETLTTDKLVTFLFIWAGLVVYSIATLREQKKAALTAPTT